jgi:pilus assembly protein CpaC
MNSTRVPTIAFGAGGVAAHPASGSDQTSRPTESDVSENLPTFALSRMPNGIADPALLENKADDRASARGESVHVAPRRSDLDDDAEETRRTPDMKCRGNQPSMRNFFVRALSFSAAAALILNPALSPAIASDYAVTPVVGEAQAPTKTRFLALGIGKSVVIDLPREVKDVLVADPKIATGVIRAAQRAYIIGVAVGQTNIVFFDAAGQTIAAYDIAVKRDLNGVRAALKQMLPAAGIQAEGVGDGVLLTGSVSSPIEAQQAGDVVARLVGGAEKVVNSIVVRGRDQVMLKVTVAEVRRDIVKQMGVDLSASMNYGTAIVNFNNTNPFTANSTPLVPGNALTATGLAKGLPSVTATLRAMETAGVVRTLAEPNLTAISGESATFISGGEFPIPTGVTCQTTTAGAVGQCVQTVSFKKFGISLNFTPVVLTEGRISLRVMTEVSEVSPDNAFLGALFRSQDFVNNQTELMVIVTPYIVRAVAQSELSRPDDGFAPASDSASTLLARINRIYGIAGHVEPVGSHQDNFGFIID